MRRIFAVISLGAALAPLSALGGAPRAEQRQYAGGYTGGRTYVGADTCANSLTYAEVCFDLYGSETTVTVSIIDGTFGAAMAARGHFTTAGSSSGGSPRQLASFLFCSSATVAVPTGAAHLEIVAGDLLGGTTCLSPPTAGVITARFG